VVNHIQKLYRIEKEIKGQTETEKQLLRLQQSKPLLDEFKAGWINPTIKCTQNSPTAKPLGTAYSNGQNISDTSIMAI
jgi:hypothetical protein